MFSKLNENNNIIIAPTGSGKTYNAVKWTIYNKVKTLIVTNSKSNIEGYRSEFNKQDSKASILFLTRDSENKKEGREVLYLDEKTGEYKAINFFNIVVCSHTYLETKGHTSELFNSIQTFITGITKNNLFKSSPVRKIIIDEGHEFINRQHKGLLIKGNYQINSVGSHTYREKTNSGLDVLTSSNLVFDNSIVGSGSTSQQWLLPSFRDINVETFDLYRDLKQVKKEEVRKSREETDHYIEYVYGLNKDDLKLVRDSYESTSNQWCLLNKLFSSDYVNLVVKKPIKKTNEVDGEEVETTTEHRIKNANNVWVTWSEKVILPFDKTTLLTATLNEKDLFGEFKNMSISRINTDLNHIDINELTLKAYKNNNATKIINSQNEEEVKNTFVVYKTKNMAQKEYSNINYDLKFKYGREFIKIKANVLNKNLNTGVAYAGHPVSTGANLTQYKTIIVECDRYRPLVARIKGENIIGELEDKEAIIMQNIGRILRTENKDIHKGKRNIYLSKCSEELAIKIEENLRKSFPNWNIKGVTKENKEKTPLLLLLEKGRASLSQIHNLLKQEFSEITKNQVKELLNDRKDIKVNSQGKYSLIKEEK